MATKRKHSAFDLEKKYEIIVALENGEKAADLARKHDLRPNTIADWKKNAAKIKEEYQSGQHANIRKKMRARTATRSCS